MITPISLKAVLLITLIKMIKSSYMIKMITSILPRGAFFGEAGGWERPLFFLPEEKVFYYHFFSPLLYHFLPLSFLPEEKVLIIVVTNLCMMSLMSLIVTGYNLKLLWQALKIEEYDWYGYGETYGSEAQLRSDYRYKQVWVWIGWVFGCLGQTK